MKRLEHFPKPNAGCSTPLCKRLLAFVGAALVLEFRPHTGSIETTPALTDHKNEARQWTLVLRRNAKRAGPRATFWADDVARQGHPPSWFKIAPPGQPLLTLHTLFTLFFRRSKPWPGLALPSSASPRPLW